MIAERTVRCSHCGRAFDLNTAPTAQDWQDSPPEIRRAQPNDGEQSNCGDTAAATQAAPTLGALSVGYIYKMVQIPTSIAVSEDAHDRTEAASYLESIANEYADEGWEFYRVDSIGVRLIPGCMGLFLRWVGYRLPDYLLYYVVTLRKPK